MSVQPFVSGFYRAAALASVLALPALLGACASDSGGSLDLSSLPQSTFSIDDLPGSETPRPAPRQTAKPQSAPVAPAAAAMPTEPTSTADAARSTTLSEARRLRQGGDRVKALALLDSAAENGSSDPAFVRERGLLALELGQLEKARAMLTTAASTGPTDWRVHSGLGVALAAEGRQQEAQMAFAKALELAPEHPTVLNNLALSYALDGRHEQAEKLLRRAAEARNAKPHARQNLALVLALKGQPGEARRIAETSMPPTQAQANVRYLTSIAETRATTALGEVVPAPARTAHGRSPGETSTVLAPAGPGLQ